MANDAAARIVLPDQKGSSDYPVHPLLAERRSLRAFSPRTVEPEILGSLLEAAHWAAQARWPGAWPGAVDSALRVGTQLLHEVRDRPGLSGPEA